MDFWAFHAEHEGLEPSEKLEAFIGLPAEDRDRIYGELRVRMDWAWSLGDIAPAKTAPNRPCYERSALEDIPPREYFERLTGAEVSPHGTTRCPLLDHDERTGSCKVYREVERGWYCFGCGRGGDIYTLAAGLWGMEARGAGFVGLKERLESELL